MTGIIVWQKIISQLKNKISGRKRGVRNGVSLSVIAGNAAPLFGGCFRTAAVCGRPLWRRGLSRDVWKNVVEICVAVSVKL